MELRGPEVDPHPAGDLAIDRSGAAVRRRSTRLFLGRQSLHFHVRVHDRVERARHLCANPGEAVVDEGHDPGAALVAFGELVPGVVRQRLHSFAHGARREAALLQDRIHLRVEPLHFSLTQLVDLVGRHGRGGRGPERPPVELLAVRARRDPRVVRRNRPLCLQLGELALEHRRNLLRGDGPRAPRPVPGDVLRPPRERIDERPAITCIACGERHLTHGLVDQERRRDKPRRARRLHALELSIELLRVRLQPRKIRLGIGSALDAMIGIEEPRDVEIGADILDDDVRRVAPAPDRHVAIWKRETVERRRVRAPHYLEGGTRCVREAARVEGVDAIQVYSKLVRQAPLALRGAIGEHGSQCGSRSGVDAQ